MTAADEHDLVPPAPRNPLTRARVEALASRAVGGFGIVFGVLSAPQAIAQQQVLRQPLGWIAVVVLYASLLLVGIAALAQRRVGALAGLFAVLFALAVLSWPLATGAVPAGAGAVPWLWTLVTVATGFAAVGWNPIAAAVYTVLMPLAYGAAVAATGDPGGWVGAMLDACYALILGTVLLVILWLVRRAASRVDDAQRTALDVYEVASRAHANEAERVEVDAIVHDSVLTTLLTASKAVTAEEQRLASRMAADALAHIDWSNPARAGGAFETTDAASLASGIEAATVAIGASITITTDGDLTTTLPANAAEALHAAAVQAMVNSAQHAGGPEIVRTVLVAADARGVRVEVADDGKGFEPSALPEGRLGVANSIVQRVAIAGGSAEVRSAPGWGTTIVLRWPGEQAGGAR